MRFVEPWLLAFVNPDAKQGRCQPVMVCYALLGKTRGKVTTAPPLENFRCSSLDASVKTCHSPAPPAVILGCRRSKLQLLPTEASYTYKLELVFRAKPANIDDLLVGLSVIINRFVSNHASKTLATEPNQN